MRIALILGILFVLGCLAVVAVVVSGAAGPTTLVALGPLGIGATVSLVLWRLLARTVAQGQRVRELPTRGVRRRGVVQDAAPYGAYHGGVVMHEDGVLHRVRVRLDPRDGSPACTADLYLVEPTEAVRARIGTSVVVREHPESPDLRALEGFHANGHRLS